jgi:DNA topoisomerase-1
VKEGQHAFRKALRLPRAARHLSRTERGLIAFLERGKPALRSAA